MTWPDLGANVGFWFWVFYKHVWVLVKFK